MALKKIINDVVQAVGISTPKPEVVADQLEAARAALAEAERGYQRVLLDESSTGTQVSAAEASRNVARRNVEAAELRMADSQARALAAEERAAEKARAEGEAAAERVLADRAALGPRLDAALSELAQVVAGIDRLDIEIGQAQARGYLARPQLVGGHTYGPQVLRARLEIEMRQILAGKSSVEPQPVGEWLQQAAA